MDSDRDGDGASRKNGGGPAGSVEHSSLRTELVEETERETDVRRKPRLFGSDKYRKPLSTMFQSTDEDYTQKLPRISRKNRKLCLGFSYLSWFFLIAAFLQAALVVGFQVAIAVLGNFRRGRLEEYVACFEESIGYDNGSELPANLTFPTFGRDKEIYVYFFISLVVYNFCLCIYALKFHHIVEVYMFLIINILAIGYAGVQVFQFRGFGDRCDPITTVGYLALANAGVLAIFTVLFVILSRFIYVEFGWKIYTRVGCNSDLRWYYRVYEVFMGFVKLLILFMLIFLVGQCILLLYVDENNINYEFWVVIFGMVPAAIATYPFVYYIVRHEHILGSIAIFVLNIGVICYAGFKVFRYISRSCPLCREQVREFEEDVDIIQFQLQQQLNSTETFDTAEDIIDRIEQFEHLVMLGVVNLLIAVVVLIVYIYFLKQYRKGLKDYFASERSWCGPCSCCCPASSAKYDITARGGVFLNLKRKAKNWNSVRHSEERSSEVAVRYDRRGTNFNATSPTIKTASMTEGRGIEPSIQ